MVSYRIIKDSGDDDFISPTRFDVLDILIAEHTFAASIDVKCKTLKCAFDHFISAYKLARANNAIPNSIAVWCDSFFALDFPEYYDGLELESIFVGYEHIDGHPDKWIYNFEFDDNEDSFFINFALNYAVAGIVKDFPTVYHPFPPTLDLFDDLDKSVPSANVKEASPVKNLNSDTLNAESAVAKIDTATIPAEMPTPTLEQLTVEVKFYLGQIGQNIIEVGKRLIQAKALLPHGEWGNWLKDNFNLTQQSANRFMRVAERFGKLNINVQFQSTQMITMLELPADETEAFIEAKAAEGTPVEDMTVKNLRAEIADWKRRANDAQLKNSQLEADIKNRVKTQNSLQTELAALRFDLDDAVSVKKSLQRELAAAQQDAQNARFELQNRPIEVVPPSDYHDVKDALAKKDAVIDTLQQQLKGTTDALNSKKLLEDYGELALTIRSLLKTAETICWHPHRDDFLSEYDRRECAEYRHTVDVLRDLVKAMTDMHNNQK